MGRAAADPDVILLELIKPRYEGSRLVEFWGCRHPDGSEDDTDAPEAVLRAIADLARAGANGGSVKYHRTVYNFEVTYRD
jgi:hypothetical protein